MANNSNFDTNIQALNGRYTRYMVSRVIDNPLDKLLELEVPTTIPEYFTVELSFYTLADNSLIASLVLDSNDESVFTATTMVYADTSIRRLLFVDFSKIDITLEQGRFQVVMNFFIPEIGTFSEPQLVLTDISPSRKEVEFSISPEYITTGSINKLVDFASPQISSQWVLDAVRQIFNQPASATSNNIPTDSTNLTFDIVEEFLPVSVVTLLNDENTSPIFTGSLKLTTQTILNNAYGFATQSILASSSVVYTDTKLNTLVSKSIAYGISTLNFNQYSGSYSLV